VTGGQQRQPKNSRKKKTTPEVSTHLHQRITLWRAEPSQREIPCVIPLALWIFIRDRRASERTQPDQLAAWSEWQAS
jgi:hypothetical protein